MTFSVSIRNGREEYDVDVMAVDINGMGTAISEQRNFIASEAFEFAGQALDYFTDAFRFDTAFMPGVVRIEIVVMIPMKGARSIIQEWVITR
jgi:hypothetical protein